MEPSPSEPVPIYVGGHSDPALRRAARLGDGWIGAQVDQAEAAAVVKRLHEALDEAGRSRDGFEVKLTPIVPATPEAMGELASVGVTDVITVPWFFAGGDPTDPAEQERSIAWFADTVIDPVRAAS
jgi:alkanesulfonate monooxygenase SsuD/methylene tetrahydromethanopterin reductase-like flavin-dependent oxidoreductase (luciferase family)